MATLIRGTKAEITVQLCSEAANVFAQWIGCYTVIWNCKFYENKTLYEEYLHAKALNPSASKPKPNKAYAHFATTERSWLNEVPSQIRRNAACQYIEALNACLQGIRKAPTPKNQYSKKNCQVTNELFDLKITDETIEFYFKKTNKSLPFCHIVLPKKKEMKDGPKIVWLARQGDRYILSYSYTQESLDVREEQVIIDQLKQAPEVYQQKAVVGLDVGVDKPVALSTHQALDFTDGEKKSLKKNLARQLKYQRKLSRQQEMAKKAKIKPGKNAQKTKAKLAHVGAGIGNTRSNMAHRTSKSIAEEPPEVVVCEKLQIKNMTTRPKAKQDPVTGKWIANGARAKAGLNKSILNVGWGRLLTLTEYKLRERDKMLVRIHPQYSSQECHECGHIAKENRLTQKTFCCVKCGHQDNADYNAASVLKKRFLIQLNKDIFVIPTKAVKKIAVRRQKAAGTADSVCRADIRPTSVGSGVEAETSRSNLEHHLFIGDVLEGILEARPL